MKKHNIGDLIRTLPAEKDEIKKQMGASEHEFQKVRAMAKEQGFNVFYDRSDKVYKSNVNESYTMSDLEESVVEYIKTKGLDETEAKKILRELDKPIPKTYGTHRVTIPDSRVKYMVLGDTHMGHKMYRPDILDHAARRAKSEGVEFILHTGDILEGMSGREGHIYELEHLGATNQMNYAVGELEKLAAVAPVKAITATNSHDGWFSNKGNTGFEVGPELDRRIDNFEFIGYDEVDVKLDSGLNIRLNHPGGGTAYAISYKMQKYIHSLSGGQKPNIIHQGHFHKINYLFYRNIHAFDAGALQAQTIFMKKMGTPSMLGYTIVDVGLNKKGQVDMIRPEFVTFYE